jgi:hypothetical protein
MNYPWNRIGESNESETMIGIADEFGVNKEKNGLFNGF